MFTRSRRIQWNGCRVHDAASGLWSGSSITGDSRRAGIIQMVFNKDDKIILDDIGYHKIGSIFKYNIDSKEVELEVVESSDASCEGCAFNNSKNYYCKDTHCIDVDRKDDIDVIYKKVKRS